MDLLNHTPGPVPSSTELFCPALDPSPSPTPNLDQRRNEKTHPAHESHQIITESTHHALDAPLNHTDHISSIDYPLSCSDNLTTCVLGPLQNTIKMTTCEITSPQNAIQMTTCIIGPPQNDILLKTCIIGSPQNDFQKTTCAIDPPHKQLTTPALVPPITDAQPTTPALGPALKNAQMGTPALDPPLKEAQMGTPSLGPPLKDAQMGTPSLGPPLKEAQMGTPSLVSPTKEFQSSVSPECFFGIEKLVVPSSTPLDREKPCRTTVFAYQSNLDLVSFSSSPQGLPVVSEFSGPSPVSLLRGKYPTVLGDGCLKRTETPMLNQSTPMLRMVEKVNCDQDKINQHEAGRFPQNMAGVVEKPGESTGRLLDSTGAEDSSIHQISRETMEWESGCKPQYSHRDERFNSSIRKRRHDTVSSNVEKSINAGGYYVPGSYLNINPENHTICSSDIFGRSDRESSPPFETENEASLPRFQSGSKEKEKIGDRLTSVFDLSLDEIENEYSGEEDELSLENQEPASKKEKLMEDTSMQR